jgi:hypothetical protein
MKKITLSILLVIIISCKHGEKIERKMSYVEYSDDKEQKILESKSKSKKNQKLFMDYYIDMNENDFKNITNNYIHEGKMKYYKDTLYLNLEKGCNFNIIESIKNDKLDGIYLIHNWELKDNNPYKKNKTYYAEYYSLLSEKYGKPISQFEEVEIDAFTNKVQNENYGALWINEGLVIELREVRHADIYNSEIIIDVGDFSQTWIYYDTVESRQNSIKNYNNLRKKEKNENRIKDSLNQIKIVTKDSIYKNNF